MERGRVHCRRGTMEKARLFYALFGSLGIFTRLVKCPWRRGPACNIGSFYCQLERDLNCTACKSNVNYCSSYSTSSQITVLITTVSGSPIRDDMWCDCDLSLAVSWTTRQDLLFNRVANVFSWLLLEGIMRNKHHLQTAICILTIFLWFCNVL